jgi:hypothetical protein
VLETKFAFAADRLRLTALQQTVEYGLEQLPWAVFIGIAQSRALRRFLNAQMTQLPFTGGQPAGDFAQTLRMPQLAKQHRDQLRPTCKTSGMPLRAMLLYRAFKLVPGNQLQHLTKNTAYSIQGGISVRWF